MQVIGIVAEYNPFHTGHAYQIRESRRLVGTDSAVAAVMSGNWVQQADCAIADKWLRTRLALMGGVDLVLELPTVWATASAEGFARGAIALLESAGVVDHLSFGSECGCTESLEQIAACLSSALCPVPAAGGGGYLGKRSCLSSLPPQQQPGHRIYPRAEGSSFLHTSHDRPAPGSPAQRPCLCSG